MTTYHPPMTALEAHMEEEIAHETNQPDQAMELAREMAALEKTTKVTKETEFDRQVETAMHLGG